MSNTQNADTVPIFGQSIDALVKNQHARGDSSDIPNVITAVILWLEAHQAITATNIFRALGHAPTVQNIKSEFEAGTWNASSHTREDMHSIAAVLKVYLRALPDSLFPSKYYSLALKIIREVPDTIQQAYQLRVCVYSLPKPTRDTILYISNFLYRVAAKQKENGVDAMTIAHIFGPYFIRPPDHNPSNQDKFVIVEDVEDAALVMKRFVEDAPFFFKASPRPSSCPPETTSAPTTSIVQGRALYPYPGGSKWLLPLQKDEIVSVLDIKNEDGWLKVMINAETGYTPLSYVQLVALPPPSDDPTLRAPIPPEYDAVPSEPVIPANTPIPTRKSDEHKPAAGGWEAGTVKHPRSVDSPHLHALMSPELHNPSPILSPKFSSPDLSQLPIPQILSPPPPLSTPPLFHAVHSSELLPPPIDLATIPPVDINSVPPPSPLSSSVPPPLGSSPPHVISPRLAQSQPQSSSLTSLPTLAAAPPPNKASSFNTSVLHSSTSILEQPPPLTHTPSLPTKLSRAFSYSAPPPPRLVAPPLPSALGRTEEEKKDEPKLNPIPTFTPTPSLTPLPTSTPIPSPLPSSASSSSIPTPAEGEKSEHDDETEDDDDDTDDYEGSSEDVTVVTPPPAPALPTTSIHVITAQDSEQDLAITKKRKERAEETLTTERTYVKQLTVVYEHFVEPLKRKEREKTPILTGADIFAIFSNIEVILNCHRKLLDTFEKRMLAWDSTPELGDIFLENTAFIKLYKYYVNNFDKSIITLKSCREKNPEFQKFAQDLDYTEKLSGLSVESFLILPVQRIPRYVLLLQDLLKYTSSTHRDFNNLSNALSFIKDLADFINSNKSDADNINKILGIQESLLDVPAEFNLVVPRRRYIEEGSLLYKKQKAWMYLFSDALVFTKLGKKGKRFKTLINLPTASLNITDEPGVLKIISTEGTFRFGAETPKDREHWTKTIREAMDASRVDMLHSAFHDGNQTEGSNKQFMKLKDEENAVKKRNLVDRLVASEQDYVESMTYIRNTFLAPLRKAVDAPMPIIALAELIDIASNLDTLHGCHVIFLQSIKERVAEWPEKTYVNDLFSEKAAFLKLYNYYVSNHHKSLETIDHCIEKYPLFAIFLRDLEAREKVELKVLLTEPLRRVSTYYLIVQEMSQYIKPKTEEYDQMNKVVSRLKEQTEKLNNDLHVASGIGKTKTERDKKMERAKSSRKFRLSNNKSDKN